MNLLITTLGTSWQIVPELFGFTNPGQLDLYANRSDFGAIDQQRRDYDVRPVDEVWVVTTVEMKTGLLSRWAEAAGVALKIWRPRGVDELATAAENQTMADLIYRAVLLGRQAAGEGRIYLSLAGGRKTMSAEMQQAGMIFGCDALLHVVNREKKPASLPQPDDFAAFARPLPREVADLYQPLVTLGRCSANAALEVHPAIRAADYPLTPDGGEVLPGGLYAEVRRRLKRADSLIYNFSRQVSGEEAQTNFHGLYMLPPELVQRLRQQRIAVDAARREVDMAWLARLPKAELHCHLGGILDAAQLVEVAAAAQRRVEQCEAQNPDLRRRLTGLRGLIERGDLVGIRSLLAAEVAQGDNGAFKTVRRWHSEEPWGVCAFLLAFRGRAPMLDELIFGPLREPGRYRGIGIQGYEPLGDLQGSGLLQSRETLAAACRVLREIVRRDHVRYLELRCSPHNYTRGGLSAEAVVHTLIDELADDPGCRFRLMFIASRHRRMSEALQHVELAQSMREQSARFRDMFVGFDLAGDESVRSPSDMRTAFRPLLEACIPITIHAGENQDVKNIWEAAYELSADRIGHGLTLRDQPQLLQRFAERRIAVEMCPSSNFQIVGYRDRLLAAEGADYPLEAYLEEGLRVTVNTDNPGISRTNASQELYKAAAMSRAGLTRWQILQLVRNGFQAAFCPLRERREILQSVEREIVDLLADERAAD